MRAFSFTSAVTLAALFNGAVANWNDRICGGSGGCLGVTWFPNAAFSCPDGSSMTNQKVAQNLISTESGNYDIITADAFPDSCLGGRTPGANDTLTVHGTENQAQKMFAFITETCREENPTADCYNQNPNPSGLTLCQITTPSGGACTQGADEGK